MRTRFRVVAMISVGLFLAAPVWPQLSTTQALSDSQKYATAANVDKNVVYGMYSGLALLMDVYHPERPNGFGVVFIAGSGWQAPLTYDAVGLKDTERQISTWVSPLVRAGYTVFVINHRAAPRFHYPAAVEDAQRAVRFVRHYAKQYAIDPIRLGGVGGSSGAHLIALIAMLGASGVADDPDPVNRESATLQCVVLRAAPSDLKQMIGSGGFPQVVSFMDLPPFRSNSFSGHDEKVYTAASPIAHVSRAAPPVLLLHGDADKTVPYQQSVSMEVALRAANVPVKLVRIPGGEHGPDFGAPGKPNPEWPDFLGEMVRWLDQYLKMPPISPDK
jgi:acetyl esterase/lipase